MSLKVTMGILVALTSVLASPAFAATAFSTDNDAYVQQVAAHQRAHVSRSVHGTAGQYVGSDPDPFIRSQLARDPSQGGSVMER
jgi:hypothetical protein